MLLPAAALVGALAAASSTPGGPIEPYYDCQLREIAKAYTNEVVLGGWSSPRRRAAGLALVTEGLKTVADCPAVDSSGAQSPTAQSAEPLARAGVIVYVSTTGSDSAAGTAGSPLRTVSGAQAWIRAKFPTVSARPAITVSVAPGDYFFGAAPAGHVHNSTRYSGYSLARFSALDSGSSAEKPITFTSSGPTPARFVGGLPLANLSWAPATGMAGVFSTTVPGDVEFDVQDQLFLFGASEHPLIRGREIDI